MQSIKLNFIEFEFYWNWIQYKTRQSLTTNGIKWNQEFFCYIIC